MTSQELMKIFTYPYGIQQDYRTRQLAIENIMYQLYEEAGLPYPKVYGFKSPQALQLAINYLQQPLKLYTNSNFYDDYPAFGRAVEGLRETQSQLNSFFWKFIMDRIIKEIPSELKLPEISLKRFLPFTNFCDTIDNHVQDALVKSINSKNLTVFPVARHPHFRDVAWTNLYAQHLDKLPSKAKELFTLFYDLIKNGLMYAYQFQDMVLWCPLPTILHINDLKQLHSENGPAIKWEDGFSIYLWKGIRVKKRLIEFPESISRLDILSEEDLEVRQCIREKLGPKRFASLFDLIEIDADLDSNGHRNVLYRTTHMDDLTGKPYFFAKLNDNTGIHEQFVEVPASTHNVWQAMAYVFGERGENTSSGGVTV